MQDLDEADLREIVQQILNNADYRDSDEVKQITSLFSEDGNEKIAVGKFILRAPTGRKYEEYFVEYFEKERKPIDGSLIDYRD